MRDRFAESATLFAILFGLLPLLLAAAALAGPANGRGDSLLRGPAPGPCATAGAEYIGGTDAYGRPVAPADAPGVAAVHLDSETVYPVAGGGRNRGGTEVKVDVKGLAAILDAPAACSPRH